MLKYIQLYKYMYIIKEVFRAMASNRNWDTVILRFRGDKTQEKRGGTFLVDCRNFSGEEK